jgi:hypothetical protein
MKCLKLSVLVALAMLTPATPTFAQDAVDCMMTIYEHAGFRGRERMIVADIDNLGAADDNFFNDRVSSFVVHKGKWQMFRHAGFNIPYAPTLVPGKYKWVEDVGIENDQVSSLKCVGKAEAKLSCRALPTEDYQAFAKCATGEKELTKWCSGDCNGDDARVVLCCSYVISE